MSKTRTLRGPDRDGEHPRVLTLTEVAEISGISIPTLQRYKKLHGARIPSEGVDHQERYPMEAVEIFHRIRQETLERNSLPRPSGRLLSLTAQRRAALDRPVPDTEAVEAAADAVSADRGVDLAPPLHPRPSEAPLTVAPPDRDRVNGRESRNLQRGLVRRLERLESSQIRLEKELEALLAEVEAPWTGIVEGLV